MGGGRSVPQAQPAAPAFGAANLSNCEREQIHLAGCIQPHGALLSVRESDQTILQASANARAFLGLDAPLPGLRLRALGADLWQRAQETPNDPEVIPYVARCRLGDPRRIVNALLHRAPAANSSSNWSARRRSPISPPTIERALQTIIGAGSLPLAVRRDGADVQGDQRLRPRDDLSLRRRGPRRGVRRNPQARARSVPRQPLPRLRHSADRPPALCAQPRPHPRRRAIRARRRSSRGCRR